VNVLSILSWISVPSAGGYSASKAAAWSLTNWLRTGGAWARYASCGGARRSDRYGDGEGSHAAEGHT
jgi:hypothetical protein